jgi:transcriptional regulator with XRE-family HTH domain
LREVREEKGLSESDISGRLALRRAYISRGENAENVPPIRILQRWARVLEVPLYELLYDGKTPPEPLPVSGKETIDAVAVDGSRERYFNTLRRLLPRLKESDRKLLLLMAQTIHRRRSSRRPPGFSRRQPQVVPRAVAS